MKIVGTSNLAEKSYISISVVCRADADLPLSEKPVIYIAKRLTRARRIPSTAAICAESKIQIRKGFEFDQ